MPESKRSRRLSIQEYFEMEEASELRHEYVRGNVFAMSGGSLGHGRICGNLFLAIGSFVDGTGCTAYFTDAKVHIEAADCIYYPDIMVTCEPFNQKEYVVYEPVLIIEVLSPSTEQTDRREKLSAYKMIPSLKQYVIVHQNRMKVEVHQRVSEDTWDCIDLHRTTTLQIDCCVERMQSIPVEQIYKGLDLPPIVREEEAEYEIV